MKMTMTSIQHGCLGLLLLLALPVASSAEATADSTLHRGVSAKPVKRTPPLYPRAELERNQQGWVQMSYVVTPEGEVIDPVVEDSSGSRLFERAALRTVKNWSYEPATWDDQPVQQCQTKVMITFALEDVGKKVSRKFRNRYKKIDKTIADGMFV